MIFPKTLHWNMVFLVLWGKTMFLFPKIMILFFRWKMKDDLSPKKDMKIRYSLQMFWKDGLFIKVALEFKFYLDSSVTWQKAVFSKISIKKKSRSQLSRQFVGKRFQVPTIIFNPLSWLGRSPMSTFDKKQVPRLTSQVLLHKNSPSSPLLPSKKMTETHENRHFF